MYFLVISHDFFFFVIICSHIDFRFDFFFFSWNPCFSPIINNKVCRYRRGSDLRWVHLRAAGVSASVLDRWVSVSRTELRFQPAVPHETPASALSCTRPRNPTHAERLRGTEPDNPTSVYRNVTFSQSDHRKNSSAACCKQVSGVKRRSSLSANLTPITHKTNNVDSNRPARHNILLLLHKLHTGGQKKSHSD